MVKEDRIDILQKRKIDYLSEIFSPQLWWKGHGCETFARFAIHRAWALSIGQARYLDFIYSFIYFKSLNTLLFSSSLSQIMWWPYCYITYNLLRVLLLILSYQLPWCAHFIHINNFNAWKCRIVRIHWACFRCSIIADCFQLWWSYFLLLQILGGVDKREAVTFVVFFLPSSCLFCIYNMYIHNLYDLLSIISY